MLTQTRHAESVVADLLSQLVEKIGGVGARHLKRFEFAVSEALDAVADAGDDDVVVLARNVGVFAEQYLDLAVGDEGASVSHLSCIGGGHRCYKLRRHYT